MKKILMLVGVLGLTACGGATLGDCPTDSLVAQKAGRALVAARCANCHNSMVSGPGRAGAPENVNYDTLAAIRLNADSGWSETESKSMPEGSTLNADEIENIRVFLACGAPDVQ
jgi:mono/diheme cytochrome c family protein